MLKFKLPDTGEGVTEGTFLEWLVEEGEEVEEDQTVAEVETDKAVVDVPAPADGTIKELRAEPGDTVDVGEVIMVMDAGGGSDNAESTGDEEVEGDGDSAGEEQQEEKESEVEGEEEVDAENDTNTSSSGDVLALPKVRKLAEEKNVDLDRVNGSGPGGRITEDDVNAEAGDKTVAKDAEKDRKDSSPEQDTGTGDTSETPANVDVKATPAVRKLAREKSIDLTGVKGSGRGGKITREDVLEAASGGSSKSVDEEKGETTSTERGEVERVEMSPSNKVVAEKMEESRFTAPHVTHIEKVDITELVELREDKKDEVDVHLTYLPFIMKAVLVGLKDYPDLNAELDEESEEVVRKKYYDFNIAVDTERGLRIPVIDSIDDRTIVELAQSIGEKVDKTLEGEISKDEMEGGTFSITNLGVIGGDAFTPIINPPQVAILGIGKISETAEVVDGEIVPRHTVKLSLSYDHRVIDGATAARFMNTVVENLEDPGELLMEI